MDFHSRRDELLAEVHARPSSPIEAPMLVTRIVAVSGQEGADSDRQHMTRLCQQLGQAIPSQNARWCALDAGNWQLRWERHSEFSSWTFSGKPGKDLRHAADRAPAAWLAAQPAPILVLTTVEVRNEGDVDASSDRPEQVGALVMDGAASLFTDLRPDADGFTRYLVVVHRPDPPLIGRLVQMLLEIETYRLMALLAFPEALDTSHRLTGIETEIGALAAQMANQLGIEDDRALLARMVEISARMEAMGASTSFRFGASRAYYGIVLTRIAWLREQPLEGHQTIGDFIERRVGPAMRTCDSVAGREANLISRIARTGQMLNTRIELVTQAINAELLESMNRRALAQLRLQRTVESLSVAAISYYVLSLLAFPLKALHLERGWLTSEVAVAIAAPFVVLGVWLVLRRVRQGIERTSL